MVYLNDFSKKKKKKMACIKGSISLDAPIEELIQFYWQQRRGCCARSMIWRRRTPVTPRWSARGMEWRTFACRESCGCSTRSHQLECGPCDQFIEEVLMEIWRRWEHDSWWEFGLFFFRLNILGEFDSFFQNIDGESVKLSHMETYLSGFRPGLVTIL